MKPDNVQEMPPGASPVVLVPCKDRLLVPVVEQQGRVGISDSKLMGVLAVLGHDPITDRPQVCGRRCWWWFDDPTMEIHKTAVDYFARYGGNVSSLSFIRTCFDNGKKFAEAAKLHMERAMFAHPATLRRL